MDVKTLCLGVLTLRDMTGYEIKKHFEESFAHFFVAGYGSIYPALGDLTREGLVSCRDVAQAKRPDKKVYSLTEAGREALLAALLATTPRHKVRSEFLVLLYFAHLLPPARLAEVLEQRLEEIDRNLECIRAFEEQNHPSPSREMVAGIGRSALEAQRDCIKAHLDEWLACTREKPVALSRAS